MNAKNFAPWGKILTILALALAGISFAAAAPQKPNILLIISDDHAWTDYGFMGSTNVRTPRLDALAARSRWFPRGYVPASVCAPSLASIITGKYPHQHGVVCNDPPMPAEMTRRQFYASAAFREGRARLTDGLASHPTLPRVLGEAGYASLQTGKWWQKGFARGGFTEGMTHGDESRGGRHGDLGLRIGRPGLEPIYNFIDKAQSNQQPFFVWYAPLLPHDPHTPPDRLLRKYTNSAPSLHVAKYWAMVEWFDESCGALLDHLQKRGLSSNTIVAYVADNGWIQSVDSPRYAPRSKQSQYDGGLRTPIMLSWPSRIVPEKVDTPVSSIDLMPTLLNLAGIAPPQDLPGLDLMNTAAVQNRPAIFGACFTHDCVDLANPSPGLRWRWSVSGDWKLILPDARNESGNPELYRITSDPFEKTNLYEEEKDRAAAMRKAMDQWWDPAK